MPEAGAWEKTSKSSSLNLVWIPSLKRCAIRLRRLIVFLVCINVSDVSSTIFHVPIANLDPCLPRYGSIDHDFVVQQSQLASQQLSVGLWVEHLATNVNHEFLQGVEVQSHSSMHLLLAES